MSEIMNVAIATDKGFRLEKDKNYCMLITNVSNNKKSLFKAGNTGKVYINRLFLKDANGNTVQAEFLSDDDNQQIFKAGDMAQFYVDVNGTFVDEIKPLPEWLKGSVTPCPNPHAINSIVDEFKNQDVKFFDHNPRPLSDFNMLPNNNHLAISFAKDIVCAQIAAGAKLTTAEVMAEMEPLVKGFFELLKK